MLRSLLALLVVVVATAFTGDVSAADTKDVAKTERARQHWKQAETLFRVDRFADALKEYQEAYVNVPDATFLFNIAQCHRLMGNAPDAIKFYRRYLQDSPQAPNRPLVEKHIRDLQAQLDAGTKAPTPVVAAPASPTPPPVAATPPPAAVAPPPFSAPREPPSPVTTPDVLPDAVADSARRPFYSRWWFWAAAGVVVVGIVAAAAASGGGGGVDCPSGRVCQ